MDDCDRASELESIHLESAIARARSPKKIQSSTCLNCSEVLKSSESNFCDIDCRNDFEKKENLAELRVCSSRIKGIIDSAY